MNAFHSGSHGTVPVTGIVKRDNLTLVPELIIYDRIDINDIMVFTNRLGVIITIQPYGSFKSLDKALADYLTDATNLYTKSYGELKLHVLSKYSKMDTDWNMLIYVSKTELPSMDKHFNRAYVTDSFDINHFKTYGFLDCCFIYESTYYIKEYLNSVVNKRILSKIDAYLIGFYLGAMNKVVKPSTFLVNKDELELYNKIYEHWDISMNLTLNINSTVSIIEMLSFTWKHDKEKRQKLTSYLLTMLSLTLSFTSLYDFFTHALVKQLLTVVFTLLISIVFILFIIDSYQYLKQVIQFKKNIQK